MNDRERKRRILRRTRIFHEFPVWFRKSRQPACGRGLPRTSSPAKGRNLFETEKETRGVFFGHKKGRDFRRSPSREIADREADAARDQFG